MTDEPTYTGLVHGGPLDGQRVVVHTEAGFVATDRRDGKAWVYQYDGNGGFVICTDHDSTLTLPQGAETGERRLDWQRLDEASLAEVPVVDVDENDAGRPVDDGWSIPPPPE